MFGISLIATIPQGHARLYCRVKQTLRDYGFFLIGKPTEKPYPSPQACDNRS
jgi:hypothetical protein